jgi:hypothetical protein
VFHTVWETKPCCVCCQPVFASLWSILYSSVKHQVLHETALKACSSSTSNTVSSKSRLCYGQKPISVTNNCQQVLQHCTKARWMCALQSGSWTASHSKGWKIRHSCEHLTDYKLTMDMWWMFTWGWYCIIHNPCNINKRAENAKNLHTMSLTQPDKRFRCGKTWTLQITVRTLCTRVKHSSLDCNDGWDMGPFVQTLSKGTAMWMASQSVTMPTEI